ncbi:MAG: hypothetical protein KA763_12440 [Xanthomonadales bacterium]|nr:hypothetical protein [Xanthomonadales bacterium]
MHGVGFFRPVRPAGFFFHVCSVVKPRAPFFVCFSGVDTMSATRSRVSSLKSVSAGYLRLEEAEVFSCDSLAESVAQEARTALVECDVQPSKPLIANVQCDASFFGSGDGELRVYLHDRGLEVRYIPPAAVRGAAR